MFRAQLIVLTIILGIFGFIFWLTQQNSILSIGKPGPTPSISFPPEGITPLVTIGPQQQQNQQQTPKPNTPQAQDIQGPPKASSSATIKTSKGTIKISLVLTDAPNAITNFIAKSKSGYYKNLTFHRVEDWVIQGGDPKGDGTGGGQMVSELNNKPFTTGAVGFAASSAMQMGQGARVSNDSQFFIVKIDSNHLDGQYTNFATVTEGMSVVNKIQSGDKILRITIE